VLFNQQRQPFHYGTAIKSHIIDKSVVTKKRGVVPTHRIIEPLEWPNTHTELLYYLQTSKPSSLGLSTDTCVYTRQIRSKPYTATKPTSPGSISFLPSLLYTQVPIKNNILLLYSQIIYTPRAQALSLATSPQNSRPSSHKLNSLSCQISATKRLD
jgi:hypothetical protein